MSCGVFCCLLMSCRVFDVFCLSWCLLMSAGVFLVVSSDLWLKSCDVLWWLSDVFPRSSAVFLMFCSAL